MKLKEIRIVSDRCDVRTLTDDIAGGLSWHVENGPERFSLTLHSAGETELKSVTACFAFDFKRDDLLLLNGYQSWTNTRERGVNARMRTLRHIPPAIVQHYKLDRYGDYTFVKTGRRPGQTHGFSYGYIRRGEEYILLGSLAEESGFTVIHYDTWLRTITLQKDCAGHHFTGDYPVFDLAILRGGEDQVFDRWFELMGIAPATGKRLTGYTSWYNLYENISEESIARDLAAFAGGEKLPDVFQIDDGYEQAVGDWLKFNERFPRGIKIAADWIREAGMMPGLWLAPFAAEEKSDLVREHPDWLLRDEKGVAQAAGCNWSGFYGLDIYNDEFRAYLKQVFDTVIREWGYGLVKLDFLYAACLIPRRDKTRAQVMYDGMRLLRELCGDALILGCGVPLAPAFGLVDYCRIGCDVSLYWNDKPHMQILHRERVSTKHTLLDTVFRRQLDGRAWRNDPDVFLLRDDNIQLTDKQKKLLATVNALFGGVLFTSDNVGAYDGEKRALYERVNTLSRHNVTGVSVSRDRVVIRYRDDDGAHSAVIPL